MKVCVRGLFVSSTNFKRTLNQKSRQATDNTMNTNVKLLLNRRKTDIFVHRDKTIRETKKIDSAFIFREQTNSSTLDIHAYMYIFRF